MIKWITFRKSRKHFQECQECFAIVDDAEAHARWHLDDPTIRPDARQRHAGITHQIGACNGELIRK